MFIRRCKKCGKWYLKEENLSPSKLFVVCPYCANPEPSSEWYILKRKLKEKFNIVLNMILTKINNRKGE